MRIDLTVRLYLSPEEYARYEGSESLQITLRDNGEGPLGAVNTTEPSREVPKGDLITVGEAALTVESAGFAPLRGSFTPVRADEPGTQPWDGHPAGHECPGQGERDQS